VSLRARIQWFQSLSAGLSVICTIVATQATAFADEPPDECPVLEGCIPVNLELCGIENVVIPSLGFFDKQGNECFGCPKCLLDCPKLECPTLPNPCDLVVKVTFPFEGKTCEGCSVCKMCPAPTNCAPCGPGQIAKPTTFPFETIMCPGCNTCEDAPPTDGGADAGADASRDGASDATSDSAPTDSGSNDSGKLQDATSDALANDASVLDASSPDSVIVPSFPSSAAIPGGNPSVPPKVPSGSTSPSGGPVLVSGSGCAVVTSDDNGLTAGICFASVAYAFVALGRRRKR
jgi:hypothetical protein